MPFLIEIAALSPFKAQEKKHTETHMLIDLAKKSREFIYQPIRPRATAGKSALKRVLYTFFDGSLTKAMAVHLSDSKSDLSDEEIKQLGALIRQAKKKGV